MTSSNRWRNFKTTVKVRNSHYVGYTRFYVGYTCTRFYLQSIELDIYLLRKAINHGELPPYLFYRTLTKCMPLLISFARAFSNFEEHKASEKYKIKMACPQWDANSEHSTYIADALPMISTILVCTLLNYLVLGISTAAIFPSNDHSLYASICLGWTSCLISFVLDQSTCQERVKSDKIQNEKF